MNEPQSRWSAREFLCQNEPALPTLGHPTNELYALRDPRKEVYSHDKPFKKLSAHTEVTKMLSGQKDAAEELSYQREPVKELPVEKEESVQQCKSGRYFSSPARVVSEPYSSSMSGL